MKILHCADLHLDSKMETHLSPNKAKERKAELRASFSGMFDYAKENGIEAVIIAGDLFDSDSASRATKNYVLSTFRSYLDIKIFYLPGNHDEGLFAQDCDLPENVTVFTEEWKQKRIGNVVITGAILNEYNLHTLPSALHLPEDTVNIAVLHGQTSAYRSDCSGGQLIPLPAFKNKNIDYLALGHLHSFSRDKLDARGIYSYCGCLEGRGFDECGEKGFVVIETQTSPLTVTFLPFAKRTLHKVECDISGLQTLRDIELAITNATRSIPQRDMVEIILTGTFTEDTDKNTSDLEVFFADRFYFIKIKDNAVFQIDPHSFAGDVSLRGEFVRQVLSSDLDAATKNQVILTGLKALKGEKDLCEY